MDCTRVGFQLLRWVWESPATRRMTMRVGVDHRVSGVAAGVRDGRGRLAADDRRCLMDQVVVGEGIDHE